MSFLIWTCSESILNQGYLFGLLKVLLIWEVRSRSGKRQSSLFVHFVSPAGESYFFGRLFILLIQTVNFIYWFLFYLFIFLIILFLWISSYVLGRKVAIDASMSLYQFLIAVRSEGQQLVSADGETTRYPHLFTNDLHIYILKILVT